MRLFKLLLPAALAAFTLSACGSGGSGGSLFGGNSPVFGPPVNQQCDPGTQVQLANPLPNQSNVSPNIGSITIVADGNNNYLYQSYNQWSIVLTDSYTGYQFTGGPLQLVADPNGPHPYGSDYYYSSSMGGQTLNPGDTYDTQLVQMQTGCSTPLQSFSTN